MSEPGRLKVGFRQYKGLIWTIWGNSLQAGKKEHG